MPAAAATAVVAGRLAEPVDRRRRALLPSAFTISETKLRQSQPSPVVRDPATGTKYVRPAYWQ
ncbi:hypothetical protein GCM10027074_66890 [Streptomyces deserti]